MVTLVALCYLLLHIGKDHTLYIYHDLVSLAGQMIHLSIHSFIPCRHDHNPDCSILGGGKDRHGNPTAVAGLGL
jgi:hypothetical protein